jgi:hypothetical protein
MSGGINPYDLPDSVSSGSTDAVITNWPDSQTIDGTVAVSSLPAIPHDALTSSDVVTVTGGAGQTADVKVTLDSESVAVTGAFYQATQPVSGPLTNIELRAAPVPTADANFEILLRQLIAGIYGPAWLNPTFNTLQISSPTAANLLCTATVGTVGDLTKVGALNADQITYNDSAIQWATCIRGLLT